MSAGEWRTRAVVRREDFLREVDEAMRGVRRALAHACDLDDVDTYELREKLYAAETDLEAAMAMVATRVFGVALLMDDGRTAWVAGPQTSPTVTFDRREAATMSETEAAKLFMRLKSEGFGRAVHACVTSWVP